jgi:hypothetical protein
MYDHTSIAVCDVGMAPAEGWQMIYTIFGTNYEVDVNEWTVFEIRNCKVKMYHSDMWQPINDRFRITHIPSNTKVDIYDIYNGNHVERVIEHAIDELNLKGGK